MAAMCADADPNLQLISSFVDCIAGDFDYVIIGSSFCALGFIEQMLHNNPAAKILIIEKGRYRQEIQSLNPIDLGKEEKDTECVSWDFSTDDQDGAIKNVRGINCLVGGRSCYWKAWCPKPTRVEMAGWPEEASDHVLKYFPHAEKLLSVKPVNEIGANGGKLFNLLQNVLFEQLNSLPNEMEEITRTEHAPLAIIEKNTSYGKYEKYSVVDPLFAKLEKHKNLKLLTECEVTMIQTESSITKATCLQTSKGDVPLGQAKLILAMSTLPSTTLLLNSFPSLHGIVERFTGHFASYVFARVSWERNRIYSPVIEKLQTDPKQLEIAAFYIPGKNLKSRHQFHIQLNAVAVPDEETNLEEMRHLLKTPKPEMLESCHNHIIFVCASLGQTDHGNTKNRFYMENGKSEPTLSFTANGTDKELWDTMDATTFHVLEKLSCADEIEYWNSELKQWQRDRPPQAQIRYKYLVHPASTVWIEANPESPVDLDYKLRGVDNVYLTGGALWPTGASWNPTCAMTAMAMHLADSLSQQRLA